MQQFWQLLCRSGMCQDSVEGIQLDHCLEALTGGLSEDRFHLVRKVTRVSWCVVQ